MERLKERILRDGVAVGTEAVKVDSFLNHQIDVGFMGEIGSELRHRFGDIPREQVDKILTVESSGIAMACATATAFDPQNPPPVVFAKKELPRTLTDEVWFTEIMSFTKSKMTAVRIAKKFLCSGERVLIIDDFLAHGQAAAGLVDLIEQAEAELLGVGIVIEKAFQQGGKRLRSRGIRVESLAIIERIDDGTIVFAEGEER